MVPHGITLEDFRSQLQRMRAEGMKSFPGVTEISAEDMLTLKRAERILEAMSEAELRNIDLLLNPAVRQRIAVASGTQRKEVDELISQFAKVSSLMRKLCSRGS
jgi:signal recognition particle GTPase